jgi:hypothetical protein
MFPYIFKFHFSKIQGISNNKLLIALALLSEGMKGQSPAISEELET